MLFNYKAVSNAGRTHSGQLAAGNMPELEMRLKRMDLELIHGQPVSPHQHQKQRQLPRPELINFCFHLEQLTEAGVPILDGLGDLRDSLAPSPLHTVVAGLIESIEGGLPLSEAMADHPHAFDEIFVNLIRAGESSGQLPEILVSLTETLKWEDELASHSKKLLIYPCFVAAVILSVTVFLMIYMVPQLKMFVKNMGQTLPIQTRLLFFVSEQLSTYWLLFLLTPTLTLAGAQLAIRQNPLARLYFDNLKLRLPVLGPILKKIILARFANTFATLYAAGIPILESIHSTQHIVGNRAIRQALERVEQAIRDGCNIAGAFQDAEIFPPLVVRMLRVGENTGRLDKALRNVSYFYNRDVKEAIGKAQAMIDPVLTIVMGTLLGWIMFSVISPIYDVISKIKL